MKIITAGGNGGKPGINGHNNAADKHSSNIGTKTSDPMSLTLMLALCILAISSGTVITVLLRKNRGK